MSKLTIRQRLFGAAALAILFATSAVAAQTSQAAPAGASAQGTPAGATSSMDVARQVVTGAKAGAMSRADQKMLGEIAQANMSEIEASRLALSKSQNEQVRSFAQQMVDDHAKAMQEVQQLAQAKGVTLPAGPDRKHQKRTQRLAALSGEAFDRRYMDQDGLADHRATHTLLQRVQSRAGDAELKALAAKMQPVVEQHLASTQQLSAAMKNSGTAMGSSGTRGSSGAGAPGKSGEVGGVAKPGKPDKAAPAGTVKPGT